MIKVRKKRRAKSKASGGAIILIICLIALVVGGIYYANSNNLLSGKNESVKHQSGSNGTKESNSSSNSNTNSSKTESKKTEQEQKEEQQQEPQKSYTATTQEGEEVKVDANKMVTATGFSGASNYKFYLRGTTLYFKDTSTGDNPEEIIAYNVKDLYLKNKEVTADLYSDGQIVKENNYITYNK